MHWILGDVFHSNPKVIGSPSRYEYLGGQFGFDYNANCLSDSGGFQLDFEATSDYTCFFQMHRLRRKVLVVAANDGMFHAFDAGRYKYKVEDGELKGSFDWGTGTELFAYIPRALMPKLRDQAEPGAKHEFMFDGTPVIDDVRIDTYHEKDKWSVDDRQWRTVAITGQREGGNAYVALDLTQPDKMKLLELDGDRYVPVPDLGFSQTAPRIVPSCTSSKDGCHIHRYPAVLWEFQDLDNNGDPADDDNNNIPDLGNSWSSANTGRVKVIHDGEEIEKFVAVVGGGINPEEPGSGDWLYMIDIETGKAIYKRKLDGPAPSEPAAVDIDNNGWIDTIYIGTTNGSMYKVDVSEVVDLEKNNARPGGYFIDDAAWEPFKVFDTGGRPIYYSPSITYVALRRRYAVIFGTGERENIFLENSEEGRFYAIIDDNWTASTVPSNGYTEADLEVTAKDGLGFSNKPLLTDNGYAIHLDPDERMITKAFTLSGVTVFSTFEPATFADGTLCAQQGTSNVYTIFTSSGNAIRKGPNGSPGKRYIEREGFIGDPTAEKSSRGDGDGQHGDVLDDSLKEILQTLKDEMPDNCRFSNQTINIKAIRDNTGVEFIAPIPVCQIGKNWKQW
jgi:Tfp pilus tip-associated adhesin PilY1